MAEPIFERYGGFATINKIVDRLYEKALSSPEVAPYFAQTQMMRLVDHQTKFVATVMGGPISYSDKQLAQIHGHMGIDQAAFDAVVGSLEETLSEFGVTRADQRLILSDFAAKAPLIVTRGQSAERSDASPSAPSTAARLAKDTRALLDMLDTAICIVDRQTFELVFANRSFAELFGRISTSSPLLTFFDEADLRAVQIKLSKNGRHDFLFEPDDTRPSKRLPMSIRRHAEFQDWLICECRG